MLMRMEVKRRKWRLISIWCCKWVKPTMSSKIRCSSNIWARMPWLSNIILEPCNSKSQNKCFIPWKRNLETWKRFFLKKKIRWTYFSSNSKMDPLLKTQQLRTSENKMHQNWTGANSHSRTCKNLTRIKADTRAGWPLRQAFKTAYWQLSSKMVTMISPIPMAK